MTWRLTYCNKKGVEARIDIIRGNRTPVEIVQGSGNPFTLSYKLDKNDKSGHIMTSSADIEIFETTTFNIDDLKTSNETELKVEYFEDNVLTWSGFILPDFFSREIGSPNIVRMTASDRLTALKGVTLSDLPSKVSLRDLIELSLAQTGLNLGLVSQIQINQGSTNVLDSEILSQRLTDVRGRSISCYDILMSIMVGTDSTIRQRAGQWQVYNKLEHELRTPTISFDKVERGAIRTIQPVASSVGVYQEFGGGRIHPENYDFSDGLTGWTALNGFNASTNNKEILGYYQTYNIIYGEETDRSYLVNSNNFTTSQYIETDAFVVPYEEGKITVKAEINATGPRVQSGLGAAKIRFALIAEKNGALLSLNDSGAFVAGLHIQEREFSTGSPFDLIAVAMNIEVSGVLMSPAGHSVRLRFYGSNVGVDGDVTRVTTIDYATVSFDPEAGTPKGNLYKTTQGSNFTKLHDVETTIFGDHITNGLNGYFYNYSIDDTSNLYLPSGTLSPPQWITAFDTTERPLLHHVSRQKSSLFSVAHDILKANINVESFDPLAIFQDCKGGKYIVVSASFDFLRSEVDVELEQIAYDNTILKRDFIYSYFGEGESNIKSIGGIAGGSGGTGGGGMTSEQLEMLTNLADWWRLDAENDAIYSLKSVYSLKGVSALGLGSEGGGGGGDYDRLDDWVDYNETKANWVLSALLGYDLHTRVNDLEAEIGSIDIGIAVTGVGNAVTGVSKSGNTLTFAKSSTFALSTHSHTIAQITGLQGALDSKATQSDIDTAVDGIEIGGRNLIREVDIMSLGSSVSKGTDGFGQYIRFLTSNPSSPRFTHVTYEDNTQYTLSIEASVETGSHLYWYFVYTDGSNSGQFSTIRIDSATPVIRRATSAIGKTIDYIAYAWASAGYRRIYNIKLEKGNKATDWTPAPEDLVSDWSETDVTSFSYIKNKPTQLSQFTDNIGVGTHMSNTSNPHSVNKSQIDLGNVDNVKQATKSEFDTHAGNNTIHITSDERTDWNLAYTQRHTHDNKTVIDELTQGHIDVLNKLSLDAQLNVKVDATLWATGGISALGLGDGGGSGDGVDMLDSWENYTTAKANYYVPASLLVPFRSSTLNRLTSLESGSATSITTTGSGNAVTSLTKSGNVITANKGLTFALASHTHTIAQITGLQGALDLKATQSDIDTAIDGIEIGWRNLIKRSDILNWSNFGAIQLSQGVDDFGSYYRYIFGVLTSAGDVFPNIEFKENTQYVFSTEGELESGVNPWFVVRYTDGSSGNIFYAGANEPTRVDYITEKGKTVDYIEHGHNSNGFARLYNIQLIEGNKIRPDWTPAPEDLVSDWSTTDVTSFSYIKNKPTQLSQFTDNIGVGAHITNTSNPHNVTKAQVGLGNVDNVKQATKSEFDSHIANNANPHAVTTAQIGAVDLTTNQTIGGIKTFNGRIVFDVGVNIQSTDSYAAVWNVDNLLWRFGSSNVGSVANIRSERVGIGTDSPLYKLDVSGDGRFTGNVTANNLIISSTVAEKNIAFMRPSYNYLTADTVGGSLHFITNGDEALLANSILGLFNNGNVGIGKGFTTVNHPTAQLEVRGTGRFTGSLNTPKVDFGNGFTIEPSGTELVFKYNGQIKQRMLSTGTILATGGITALST